MKTQIHRIARHRVIGAAAASALLVTLAACGSDSDSSSGDDNTSTGPAATGTISFPSGGEPKCGATATSDDPCELPAAPPEGKEVRIGFFGLSNNSYTDAAFAQAKKVAEANNATIKDIRNPFDPAEEVRQIQDALSGNQFDAYIVQPENPAALAPLFKQMSSQKIPFATFVLPNGNDQSTGKLQFEGQVLSIIAPPTEVGRLAGESTVEACKDIDPCKVGIIRGAAVLPFDTARLKGLTDALAKSDNIEVVDTREGAYDARASRAATQDMLSAHGDLTVIASLADQMSIGIEQALKAAGKTTDDIKLTSMGAGASGIEAVKAGRWYSTVLDLPGNEGYASAIAVISAARGEKISLGIDEFTTRGDIPLVLSQTNLDEWKTFEGDWTGK